MTKTAVPDADGVARTYEEILRRVGAIPGVASAGFAATIPMDGREEGMDDNPLYAEDHTYAAGQLPPLRRFKFVAPGFFQTMGTPLIAGRDLTWADLYDKGRRPGLRKLARELWRDHPARLGKRSARGMNATRGARSSVWWPTCGTTAPTRKAPATVYWPVVEERFLRAGNELCAARSRRCAIAAGRAGSESLMKDSRGRRCGR